MKMIAVVMLAGMAAVAQAPKTEGWPNGLVVSESPKMETTPYLFIGTFRLQINGAAYKGDVANATLSFAQPSSGRIDRLSDEEYARLQKLRQAVADTEKEIAKAHGVQLDPVLTHKGSNTCMERCDIDIWSPADHYEYRGQFMLINVPQGSGER